MSIQDIYNLIIAAIPAATSIVAIITIAIKMITSAKAATAENKLILEASTLATKLSTETSITTINELKVENIALQENLRALQKEVKTLTKLVALVVQKVDTNESE